MTPLLQSALNGIDRFNQLLSRIAILMLAAMMLITLIEVVMRKLLNAPTLWANDLVYMFNGALFLLSAGFALKNDAHVKIDFLAVRLPAVLRNALTFFIYLFIVAPAVFVIAYAASSKTYKAFILAEVETMSAWEPLVWPFYLGLSLGLWGLFLQLIATTIRHLTKLRYSLAKQNNNRQEERRG